MANTDHVKILKQGVEAWNKWALAGYYAGNPQMVDLTGVNFQGANLRKAFLWKADLTEANLQGAILSDTVLQGANLTKVDLTGADLTGADLWLADLTGADLTRAKATGAKLIQTDLTRATLTQADLTRATLIDCNIYGVSVWNVNLEKTTQINLVITPPGEPAITVDNLEVAQFVYLILNNKKIRDVIDTIGEKGVLILGRFKEERKPVLDAIRNKLRELGYVPMMFDFERPTQRDFTETIKTLAGLSRFIIADITNPKSSPLELQATMPDYMIPFVPIIHEDEQPFAMFRDLDQKSREWVLPLLRYPSTDRLLKVFDEAIVKPALLMSDALLLKKAEGIRERHVADYETTSE